jgi:purine-cytosine permease-like protein
MAGSSRQQPSWGRIIGLAICALVFWIWGDDNLTAFLILIGIALIAFACVIWISTYTNKRKDSRGL